MDKENIIIDGIDVSKCKHYLNYSIKYDCKLGRYCKLNPNCYFKQFQKEKFENLNNRQMVESAENLIYENSELYKNLKEKEKALDEIKKYIKDSISARCRGCTWRGTDGCEGEECLSMELRDILDIMREAKDGNNE